MTSHRKALPTIRIDRCTGCGWCVAVCAPHVLSLQVLGPEAWGPKRSVLHDAAACTGCALCAVRCPFDAIRMERVDAAAIGRQSQAAAAVDEAVLSHTRGSGHVV
jgi:ferredoxin